MSGCDCPKLHRHPERLKTAHLPGESKTCPRCGGPTFVMLHDWQGGCGDTVRRSVICRASMTTFWDMLPKTMRTYSPFVQRATTGAR